MSDHVEIRGIYVSLDELRADVEAAKDKGLSGELAEKIKKHYSPAILKL